MLSLCLAPARASLPTACGSVGINRKVAVVAIVAGIGLCIAIFSFAALKVINTSDALNLRLTPARASVSSVCDLALREMLAIVMIQLTSLLKTIAMNV